MILFFPYTLWTLSVGIFNFRISRPSNFSSMGSVPLLHYVLVCEINFYMPKITLSSLLKDTSFFYKNFVNFRYVICFVPNLMLIWPRSHGQSILKKFLEYFSSSTSYLILAPSLAAFSCFFSSWWSSSCKFSIIGLTFFCIDFCSFLSVLKF